MNKRQRKKYNKKIQALKKCAAAAEICFERMKMLQAWYEASHLFSKQYNADIVSK